MILFHAKSQRNNIKGAMMTENDISKIVVDVCFKIHTMYGPGLFESVYEQIFCYEWDKTPIPYIRQCGIKVIHEGNDMGIGFIPDIIIANKVILELKSVETLAEVHYKQLLTYLRLTNLKLGLLINFNVPLIKNGIHRIANNL
ncbi:MAG: GxxExxY protein [Chitinophagaceae bacterium]